MGEEGNICADCGKMNAEKNTFCSKCGAMLAGTRQIVKKKNVPEAEVICRACGYENEPGARRCHSCQSPFAEGYLVSENRTHAHVIIEYPELDYENHDSIRKLIKRINRSKIVIDMSNVKRLDSVGIGTIVSITNPMYGMGKEKEFRFYGLSGEVLDSLRAMSVDKVLDIYPSMETAVQSWIKSPQKK